MNKISFLFLTFLLFISLQPQADTYDSHTLCAVSVPDQDALDLLYSSHADIVGRKADVYKVLLNDEQLCALREKGLKIEVLQAEMDEDRRLWSEADDASKSLAATSYYTASKFMLTNPPAGSLMEHLLQLYNAHPDICRLYNLGATQDGAYDIIAMKVTKNPDVNEAEPKIRIYANIHGDEKGAEMVACDVLDTILAGYAASPQDQSAKKLVDGTEMWFIPMGNPYGNANNTRYNSNGVDLNRNFWGPAGSDEPPAWSEKETQAIRDLTETPTADHTKKRFATSLTFHGGDTCFNSVWNYTYAASGDEPVFWASRTGGSGCSDLNSCLTIAPHGLAKAYQDGCTTSGFWYTEGADWYITYGDTNDWSYGQWTDLDTTVEVTATKTPSTSQIPVFTAEHRQAVINYMLKTFQGIHGIMTDQTTGAPLDGTVAVTATASSSVTVPHDYPAIYTDPVVGDFHRVLQPGTYTVHCAAAGYPTATLQGVVVSADQSTIANCQMCKTSLVYSSSVVNDSCNSIAGNGIADPGETITLQVSLTNPGTVAATAVNGILTANTSGVTLLDDSAAFPDVPGGGSGASTAPHFRFRIDAGVACGTALSFSLHMTSTQGTWDTAFTLPVGTLTQNSGTPINEAFGTGNPPTGWSIVNGGTGTQAWTTANPGGRTAPSGITSPFEIIDSRKDSLGKTQNDTLTTPAFSCTGATAVALQFDTFYYASTNSTADVDVSKDNGSTWTNLSHWTTTNVGSTSAASHQALDITSLASSAASVKVRFHYTGNYSWYWMVDNVRVDVTRAPTCQSTTCVVSTVPDETAPGATQEDALAWTNSTDLSWPVNSQAETYLLYRGSGSSLPNLLNSSVDSCLRVTSTLTAASGISEIPSGDFYWFIVTARNAAGEGSAGSATSGPRQLNSSGSCQ
jgi:uncharacterized repeat protein (TIGR01451 family)